MTYPPQQPGPRDPHGPGGWNHAMQHAQRRHPLQDGGRRQGDRSAAPRARPKRTGLLVAIALAATAVIGGAVALIVVLSGDGKGAATAQAPSGGTAQGGGNVPGPGGARPGTGGGPASSPGGTRGPNGGSPVDDASAVKQVAQAFVNAILKGDRPAVIGTVCDPSKVKAGLTPAPPDTTIRVGDDPVVTGDTATITVFGTRDGRTDSLTLNAKRSGGRWCIQDGTPTS